MDGESEPQIEHESIITPQVVQERVKQFFEGVDLAKEGDTQSGIVTIRTRSVPHQIDPFRGSRAIVNGNDVAFYSIIFPNSPLHEGKVRELEKFELIGKDGPWKVKLRYSKYEGQEDEFVMERLGGKEHAGDPAYNGEPMEKVPVNLQRSVAQVFGIQLQK